MKLPTDYKKLSLQYCDEEYFDERAGILEYCENLPRQAAELKTFVEVSIHKKRKNYVQEELFKE